MDTLDHPLVTVITGRSPRVNRGGLPGSFAVPACLSPATDHGDAERQSFVGVAWSTLLGERADRTQLGAMLSAVARRTVTRRVGITRGNARQSFNSSAGISASEVRTKDDELSRLRLVSTGSHAPPARRLPTTRRWVLLPASVVRCLLRRCAAVLRGCARRKPIELSEKYIGMSGATIFAEMMKEHDVELIFGYPGGAILPVFDAIHDAETFKFILTRTCLAAWLPVHSPSPETLHACRPRAGRGARRAGIRARDGQAWHRSRHQWSWCVFTGNLLCHCCD